MWTPAYKGNTHAMYEDLLPHLLPSESERLETMARAHDPDARAAIQDLNLPADARCLDLGAGRGTMAIWLAETLPGAKVVAGDLDTRGFRDHSLPNLEVRTLDARRDELGQGVYDLIHCRALLGFLPDRFELLGRLKTALKPGAALVLTEMDFGRIAAGPSGFWASFWTAYLEFTRAQNWDLELGGRLPHLLHRQGYEPIQAKHIAPILNLAGDTPGAAEAKTWSITLATLAPKLIDGGFMTETQLREALTLIRQKDSWIAGPGFMQITAFKPPGET